jgi:hypothetical protein
MFNDYRFLGESFIEEVIISLLQDSDPFKFLQYIRGREERGR